MVKIWCRRLRLFLDIFVLKWILNSPMKNISSCSTEFNYYWHFEWKRIYSRCDYCGRRTEKDLTMNGMELNVFIIINSWYSVATEQYIFLNENVFFKFYLYSIYLLQSAMDKIMFDSHGAFVLSALLWCYVRQNKNWLKLMTTGNAANCMTIY